MSLSSIAERSGNDLTCIDARYVLSSPGGRSATDVTMVSVDSTSFRFYKNGDLLEGLKMRLRQTFAFFSFSFSLRLRFFAKSFEGAGDGSSMSLTETDAVSSSKTTPSLSDRAVSSSGRKSSSRSSAIKRWCVHVSG